MKLLANGFVLKLAKWCDPIFNDLLVVQDLWGRKEASSTVAVSRSLCQRMDDNSFISQLKGAKVSKMSQAYSHAVSHRYVHIVQDCTFKRSLSHGLVNCTTIKLKPNSLKMWISPKSWLLPNLELRPWCCCRASAWQSTPEG